MAGGSEIEVGVAPIMMLSMVYRVLGCCYLGASVHVFVYVVRLEWGMDAG